MQHLVQAAPWLILACWSNTAALASLARLDGVTVCAPRSIQRVKAHCRRGWRERRAWLFPGYLFVQSPRRIDHDRIAGLEGVAGFVRQAGSGYLAHCPTGFAEALVAAGDLRIRSPYDDAPFRPGQPVRLRAGPFGELIARVARVDKRGRVAILLDLLGSTREIVVPSVGLVDASEDDDPPPRPAAGGPKTVAARPGRGDRQTSASTLRTA